MSLERRTPLRAKAPMKRGKGLARGTPAKPKPPRQEKPTKLPPAPKRSARGPLRDPKHLDALRRLPCALCGREDGTIQPHHFEEHHGMGQKCSDHDTVPLCHEHHHVWWHGKGSLPGMTPAESLEFMRGWARRYRSTAL